MSRHFSAAALACGVKKGRAFRALPFRCAFQAPVPLERLYVIRGRAFRALLDIEAYALSFRKRLEAFGLDGAVMNEHIAALILFDEPEAFLIAEPFDFTFCHRLHPPFLKFYKSDFHHDRKKKPPRLQRARWPTFALQNVLIRTYVVEII
jgi:hypothetical protein